MSKENKTWGSQGGCLLVALALQELTEGELVGLLHRWGNHNSGSVIPYPGELESGLKHTFVEISEWLVDVAGARKCDEVKLVFEEAAGQDTSQHFLLVPLTIEDVKALANGPNVLVPDDCLNRERAALIAKQLREGIRHLM